jgi:hypothetical protein
MLLLAGGTSTGQMTKLKSISQVPSPYDKVPSNLGTIKLIKYNKTNKIYYKNKSTLKF